MRQWKGCTWALCLLFLLLRPAAGNVLPQETDESPITTEKPVPEPIFSREVAPAIRNPVPLEEVLESTLATAAPATTARTTKKVTQRTTTTAKTTTRTPATTTTTTTTVPAEPSTSRKTTTTTTEVPVRTTTTNRYKLYLRAMGVLKGLLRPPNTLPLLNSSTTIATATHAGFFSHPSVVATSTPATASPSTAITSRPRSPYGPLDDVPATGRASSNRDQLRSLLNNYLTHNQINKNRSHYNSKRMFHSDAISSSSANATTKSLAMGILRALWDDYSQNSTKYVPIALTAPSTLSTAKSIVIESTKNKVLPYPPSNLITIHNFHSSADELRPAKKPSTQHLFHPSDYDNWDEINQSAASLSSSSQQQEDGDNSIGQSEEFMSQLPISIKRTPLVTSTVSVRPSQNPVQPLRVQIITAHDNGIVHGGGGDSGDHMGNHAADGLSADQNSVGETEEDESLRNKPKKQKNKTRKKTIKNKSKKSPVTSTSTSATTTSSMIVVAEEEYGVQEDVLDDDDDPVDPDLETQQPEMVEDAEEVIKDSDNVNGLGDEAENGAMEEGLDEDQMVGEYCPRGNKFSADDRCIRKTVSNKKRPKKKFHTDDDLEMEKAQDEETDPLSRHGVKLKPPKVPKIKVPKIKVPKIKVPKIKPTHLALKHMPTMMAMMKTFFTGVSMATMYNPFNFGLWSVVLHPVTMLLIGLGGVLMYCFPWTSVAMLTSRKHSGSTIEVHRFGRKSGQRPGSIIRYASSPQRSDWLEDQAGWILGVINSYTFQTDL